MLYSLIMLTIYTVLTPFFYYRFIKLGAKLVSPEKVVEAPLIKRPTKKPGLSEEQKRVMSDLDKINNYTGDVE